MSHVTRHSIAISSGVDPEKKRAELKALFESLVPRSEVVVEHDQEGGFFRIQVTVDDPGDIILRPPVGETLTIVESEEG